MSNEQDTALSASGKQASTQPLLGEGSAEAGTENDHSYTEFYARLGTHDDELVIGSGVGAADQEHRASVTSSQDQESTILNPDRDSQGEEPLVGASRRIRGKIPNLPTVGIIATLLLLMLVLLWWASNGSKTVGPPNWSPASAYEISFLMTLSSGLEEPGVAMVDQTTKMMRVSYYSGMTTYILNSTGSSWSIIPRRDRLACYEENGVPAQKVFPDLTKFKFVRQRDIIVKTRDSTMVGTKKTKVKCVEWIYRAPSIGDAEGYQGTYTLWTKSGSTNIPVRFSFMGRSVVFGTSHFDNFTIDYFNYRDLSNEGGVDPFWLRPPYGMPCEVVAKPDRLSESASGPQLASHHTSNWNLMFPEFELERDEVYKAFHATHSVKERSEARKLIFHQTLRLVETHNRDIGVTYNLGLNKFADWTEQERMTYAVGSMRHQYWDHLPKSKCANESLSDLLAEYATVKLPDELDYTKKGLVRPAEEQGSCGASWASAVTGCIEGALAQKTQKSPVALSTQNLIDCAGLRPISGLTCEVGLDYLAYEFVVADNGGVLATEESYPRLDQVGFCHFDIKRHFVSDGAHAEKDVPNVTNCVHVTQAYASASASGFNQEDLIKVFNMRLHSVGPLAVNVDINAKDFFFYRSGIYSNVECKNDSPFLDHGMLAVGFELGGPLPFTWVRNTWGVSWGEGGYARIAQKGNICGVATAATYVQVA